MAQINLGTAANDGTGDNLRAAGAILNATGLRKNNYAATTAPGVTNDATQGYEAGSLWLNVTSSVLHCLRSPTAGAADWLQVYPQAGGGGGGSAPTGNYSATVDPTPADGHPTFSVGSFWVNITADRAWILLDAPVGNDAFWARLELSNSIVGLTQITAVTDTDRPIVERADGSPASVPASALIRGDGTALRMTVLTAAAYAALTPKVATTIYIIVG